MPTRKTRNLKKIYFLQFRNNVTWNTIAMYATKVEAFKACMEVQQDYENIRLLEAIPKVIYSSC